MPVSTTLPIAVIGAGPVGLAAAAHLIERGLEPLILEAGPTPAAAIEQWRHIRLFSPWRYNIDAAAVRLLDATGWESPSRRRCPPAANSSTSTSPHSPRSPRSRPACTPAPASWR